ncbi:MAG: CdaR family protein [Eubacteriales bacterium]|nr:CdaR family protein [Eubacteriales bacterium]MDD4389587.1 CdaR family protein [Eubacteriales bacterium]
MLRSKKSMLIISITASIILWAFVVVINNPIESTMVKNVPIKLLNVDSLTKKSLIMTNEDDFRIDVKIEGKKSEISRINKNDIIAEADLYGYGAGENTVYVSITVPANIEYVGTASPKISVNIEELVSKYQEIEVEVLGQIPAGNEVGAIKVEPNEVTVRGAKSIVDKVERVLVQIPADEVTTNERTITLKSLAVDKDGNTIDNVKLSAKSIKVTARIYSTKEVPLEVPVTGNVDSSFALSKLTVPDKVVIKGEKSKINGISSLKARTVDIGGISVMTKIPVNIDLPEGVELAKASEDIHVLVEIRGKLSGSVALMGSEVSISNVTQDYSAHVNTSEVTVTAVGRTSLINALTKDKFKLTVDAQNLEPGIHLLPIKIQYSENYDSVEINPKEIYITINEQN